MKLLSLCQDHLPTKGIGINKPFYENPPCFAPEADNPYPLCVGNGSQQCDSCCLFMNLDYTPYE